MLRKILPKKLTSHLQDFPVWNVAKLVLPFLLQSCIQERGRLPHHSIAIYLDLEGDMKEESHLKGQFPGP